MDKLLAEWEESQAIILAMPHKNSDWKPYLAKAQAKLSDLAREISQFARVILLYSDKNDVKNLAKIDNIKLLQIPTNDSWCRDFAPISLIKNNKLIMLDFIFNAWGMKFRANLDNSASRAIISHFNAKRKAKNFILEGGSIDCNGDGILLTTSRCLLESNRNFLSKQKIEQRLKKYLNLKKILWLDSGSLEGDDTDSHIDNLARFVDKNTIVYLKCSDKNDKNFKELNKMEKELKSFKNAQNEPFKLIALPAPSAIYYKNSRLPASYVNFLFVNAAIFVPVFGDKNDKFVIKIFKDLFPNKKIIPFDSRVFLRQGGGIHCLSMQVPKIKEGK